VLDALLSFQTMVLGEDKELVAINHPSKAKQQWLQQQE
jgi:hypothetical protein